jgi:hypothetical protein
MPALPLPRVPQPTDSVVIGFREITFTTMTAMARNAAKAFTFPDGQYTPYDSATGEPILNAEPVYAYCVGVADRLDAQQSIIVAAFSGENGVAERRAWIDANAATWLV